MIEREEMEWDLADAIVCGSPFVVEAVRSVGGPFEKCCVVTYPTPDSNTLRDSLQRDNNSQVINVLYVGTLQLRKGIQYLWESAGRLSESRFRFRAVGPSHMTASAQSKLEERIHCIGAVPRAMVRQHYEWADVVVLPTLSEGSANVCHEALACGRPVITTTAAGLQSKPGVSIIAMQDTDSLVHEIRKAANRPTPPASPRGKSVAEYGQEIAEIIAGLE
jgi:glycosyltransferase involved in cell wall biosynthesis